MMEWDGGMSAAGWLLMTLFWIGLIAAIVWAVVALFPGRGQADAPVERPDEILDRRLARGELDPETYDALRTKLRTAQAERG